jgi:hypothetical protein
MTTIASINPVIGPSLEYRASMETLDRVRAYCVKYGGRYHPGLNRTAYAPYNQSGIPSVRGVKLSKKELRSYCDKHKIRWYASQTILELHEAIELAIFQAQPIEWLRQQYEYVRAFGDDVQDMAELDESWDSDHLHDLIAARYRITR